MTRAESLAIWLGIIGNILLFGGKIVIGLWFHSIAIISDSLNSFTDIIASLVVYISIRTSYQAADPQHPYGHKRAQPIAGLIVAIFTGIVGFEVITQSVNRLLTGDRMQPGLLPIRWFWGSWSSNCSCTCTCAKSPGGRAAPPSWPPPRIIATMCWFPARF